MQADLILDCQNQHGEGVLWNALDQKVWWTDIEGCALWSYEPATAKSQCHSMSERVCCFAPRKNGGLIIAYADRVVLLDLLGGDETLVCEFEAGNPETRLNDGRTDRQGRLVVGGMNEVSGAPNSSVISIDENLGVTEVIHGVSCANSTCFSADGKTMYFADTPEREIVAYDYDGSTGSLSNRQELASFANEPGLPDGSCVDADGGVWNAEWEGRRVVRIAPNGTIDTIIEMPVWKPTCCAFGGPELDTLYITTSRLLSDDAALAAEPLSGGLFAVKPGFKGVEDSPFNG